MISFKTEFHNMSDEISDGKKSDVIDNLWLEFYNKVRKINLSWIFSDIVAS
jgi:hypothetical protein